MATGMSGLTARCPTPGCDGDTRYAAPGRGHSVGCTYPNPTTDQLLAEIEKGQQLGGHQPTQESLDLARKVLDGEITPAQARAIVLKKYTSDHDPRRDEIDRFDDGDSDG